MFSESHGPKGIIPRFYILPKIHKSPLAFHRIISNFGIYTDEALKRVRDILSPLTGQSRLMVKNSEEAARRIRDVPISDQDILVSFDVVSLFTKVLVPITI